MVIAEQVQYAMDGQVRPVIRCRKMTLGGLLPHDIGADHQVTQRPLLPGGRQYLVIMIGK